MADAVKKANRLKCEEIIKNLQKRGMNGYYCESSREACEKALSMIPNGARVSWGGSVTIEDIDIKDRLELVNAEIIDPMAAKDPEEAYGTRVMALMSDVFLTGTNAITLDGKLVNIDGRGNRTAALCFGPKKVIVIAGTNKIAKDEEAAMARIKTEACPANCIRLKKETPCGKTGICGNCLISGQTICSMTLVTRFCNSPDRIHVIMVNEDLGY
ncbi:MAG: lactate utilization protein [Clostridiales bacterium]|nr:lactate utilization protein [Clostridiales bacterium]